VALGINEIKSGVTVLVDNEVYMCIDAQHVKPGKGAAFVRARLRNLRNDAVQEITWRGEEKIDEAYIEERDLQYQYASAGMFHFMDTENFEEIAISEKIIGDKAKLLKDNLEIMGYFYKGESLYVNLPNPVLRGIPLKAGINRLPWIPERSSRCPCSLMSGIK